MRVPAQATMAVLASAVSSPINDPQIYDLGKLGWNLSSPALNRTVPAHLPSQVHLDLLRAGVIVFEGLDTFATIQYCDKQIASTNNQFRQYAFDISEAVKDCTADPVLSLNFGSAPNIVDQIAADPGSPQWPFGIQQSYEYPNRWFMRKEQSDFGWDWGPAFAPAGPWKPAYLVQLGSEQNVHVLNTDLDIYRQGQINYLPPDQTQPWVVNASIDFFGSLPPNSSMSIAISETKSGTQLTTQSLQNITILDGSITGVAVLKDVAPKIWWPYGLGEQNLYNVTITVSDGVRSLASVTKRTGFRTIFLNQRNITDTEIAQGVAPGAHWNFEVNGHEFYAKGSNLIPPDAFWARVTTAKMARLFDSVIAANQNMLRVWSSGAYLPDFMYDLADERGVLLWSEFEFSDAMYPVDKAFLDNVAAEVVYNVRRVNHHPSLALWAGGNEIESLILPTIKGSYPDQYAKYVGDYETLYINLILPLVYENTHSITYSPSSTTEGYLDVNLSAKIVMAERYQNLTEGHYYGDTDYYNYDTSVAFELSQYLVGRFANEFGFHSMPSLQSWQQAVDPEDLHFNSSVIMLRNHHYPAGNLSTHNFHNTSMGMGEMTMGVMNYYPVPDKTDPIANFSAWCHATQLFQADFYKSQIQLYRRGSGMPERQLGSLYWQLEDIWQAPSWAGIEYDGRWKVLHYVARDIYQPVIVSPFWNSTTRRLDVYVTSDLWEPVSGTVDMTWVDLSGKPIAKNARTPKTTAFVVGALNTTKIYSMNINERALPDPKNSILILSVQAEGRLPNANKKSTLTHQNHFTPVFPKDLILVDPHLELRYNAKTLTFTVQAKAGVSLYTWLDYPAGVVGYFEDNGFVLVPGQKRDIRFVVQEDKTDGQWVQGVTVRSLWDQTTKT
ncbi:beta-mannosidase [Aspergillus terreus]|uniref:Beta-mannosidase A n=1 Tax=Aspergillus terreus TaxID=33178 RepID=A0A5M3ZAW7_ASPTE|nr:hypothetical protein ATETN484_0010039000 [Aspergillus terreus]GFF18437.1 beta-mannosidase [Aspergillus terreus]